MFNSSNRIKANIYPVAGQLSFIKETLPKAINQNIKNVSSVEYIEITKENEHKYEEFKSMIELANSRGKRFWLVYVNRENQ